MFGLDQGLVAAGWITLAATLTRYVDRADQIVATTVYPAIVRVRDRPAVVEEAVRQVEPAGADVGVPVRRRPAAVRRRPRALRARGRVARRDRVDRRPGGRDGAPAARLQLVLVLPGARRVVAAGGRSLRARRRLRRGRGPGCAGVGELGLHRRPARVHDRGARRASRLHPPAAARHAARAPRLARCRAGADRDRAGADRAVCAVGRRAPGGAGGGRARTVAGRARPRHAPARARPARRAAGYLRARSAAPA